MCTFFTDSQSTQVCIAGRLGTALLSHLEDVSHSRMLVALQVSIHAFCQLLMHGPESMCLSFKHKLCKQKHTCETCKMHEKKINEKKKTDQNGLLHMWHLRCKMHSRTYSLILIIK